MAFIMEQLCQRGNTAFNLANQLSMWLNNFVTKVTQPSLWVNQLYYQGNTAFIVVEQWCQIGQGHQCSDLDSPVTLP